MSEGPNPDGEQLVLLARDGNLDAFNSLVDRFQDAVYSLCLRIIGNREAAEDATQETFISAHRALSRFKGGNFRSWLLRIAANESKDEIRRHRRKDAGTSIEAVSEQTGAPFEIPDDAPDPLALAERLDLARELEQLLLQLAPEQRRAIVLIDAYGFQYDEVAEIEGASLGTIKSRVHRGRERLRQLALSRPELLGGGRRLER